MSDKNFELFVEIDGPGVIKFRSFIDYLGREDSSDYEGTRLTPTWVSTDMMFRFVRGRPPGRGEESRVTLFEWHPDEWEMMTVRVSRGAEISSVGALGLTCLGHISFVCMGSGSCFRWVHFRLVSTALWEKGQTRSSTKSQSLSAHVEGWKNEPAKWMKEKDRWKKRVMGEEWIISGGCTREQTKTIQARRTGRGY